MDRESGDGETWPGSDPGSGEMLNTSEESGSEWRRRRRREEALGFRPQKDILYNQLLPYAERLDRESNYILGQIKGNLGRAVQLRELWPGVLFWTRKLSTYIRLYGRKFSKEDHVLFVKQVYELVVMPKLEISMMQGFTRLLISLLKKKELLSREDLQLPWRPLYEMMERILYSKTEHLGLNWFPNSFRQGFSSPKSCVLSVLHRCSIENVLKTLVKCCRPYFPDEATAEMLDEWKPLMCPFDVTMQKAVSYFEMFLPTTLPPHLHHKGFRLWFDELIHLYITVQNLPQWEGNLVNLFARLAMDNIGYIDWDEYIPKIFTRFLRSLNLPVGSSQVLISKYLSSAYDIGHVVVWITSMLGGPSKLAQKHLNGFFNSIASFYHPSNNGRWLMKLMKLLQRLPASVVRRLHRERYKKESWLNVVPDSHKLTEQDITDFVESIKQPVLLAMFSKTGSLEAAQALQNLALMRPELVIPPVLEKTYPALQTLTEPHQLTATLSCVIGVARSLVSGGKWFPEGPTHTLPLLMRALPGVDPNDFSKCMITFQFIATFSTLVPLVDCSSVLQERNDLSEVERELCSATAEFEDFVLQFMDRCFALIEISTLEQTREETETEKMTHLESLVELGLSSTFSTVLTQCSKEIFLVALDKVFNFATTNIFETRVAGRMVADMCRAASKCRPAAALKRFVPHCCNVIAQLTINDDVLQEQELDKELLWNLQLLSEITRVDGDKLLPYKDQLIKILQRTLHLKCKQGYILAGNLLHHLLRSTTLIYPTEYCSVPGGFDKAFTEYLPIKDWGRPGDLWKLGIQWHVASPEEINFAYYLLDNFLQPELRKLQQYAGGDIEMSRDDVHQSLCIVQNCLMGSGSLLPFLGGDPIRGLAPTLMSLEETKLCTGINYDTSRENYREVIAQVIRKLLHYMLDNSEDDTKSLFVIIKIMGDLLQFRGSYKHEFDSRWKSFNLVKKSMENRLHGKKQHIRALLIDRVMLQHELRTLTVEGCEYKTIHSDLMRDLLLLSTSTYSQVRSKAQQVFFTALGTYNFCCRDLIPLVLEYLHPDRQNISQQQLKGALYCLLGNHNGVCLANLHDWDCIVATWPAIVSSGLSKAMFLEKPSIVRLFDDLAEKIHRQYETIGLDFGISDRCVEIAASLSQANNPSSIMPLLTAEEIENGIQNQVARNNESLRNYKKLIDTLLDLLDQRNLPWKFEQIAIGFLSLLLRDDVPLPTRGIKFFIQSLNHDALVVRKMAISAVAGIMKQLKRPHKKIEIDPYTVYGSHPAITQPGDRPDNKWLHYNSSNLPRTKDEWEACLFVEKTHWGYYTWPQKLLVYAPVDQQPKLGRSRSEMSEAEQVIYDHFSDPQFMEQLIKFLSLEDRKGKDKFNPRRFCLFKGLFRNFDMAFLSVLKPHMEHLVSDSHESAQRCVAEIIAGLIRGCKHWRYEEVEQLWKILCPFLRTALSNITVETYSDWGTCIATACESRDPRKLHWLFELLMEAPLSGEGGSFADAWAAFSAFINRYGPPCLQEVYTFCKNYGKDMEEVLATLIPPNQVGFVKTGDASGNLDFCFHTSQALSMLVARWHAEDQILNLLSTLDRAIRAQPRRLYVLQGGLAQQEWRVPELMHRLLQYLEPKLTQVYKNVRERIGSVLTYLFMIDITLPNSNPTLSPHVSEFTSRILEQLKPLTEIDEEIQNHVVEENGFGEQDERTQAIKLLKTVLKWLMASAGRSFSTAVAEQLQLMPLLFKIAPVENDENYDELKRDAKMCLSLMSQGLLYPEQVIMVLDVIKQISESSSWHTKYTVLTYLQTMVFYNLFVFLDNEQAVKDVRWLVIKLLEDEQLETREMAATTLSGLLQCNFLTMDSSMQSHFEQLCKTRLPKKRKRDPGIAVDTIPPADLVRRHAGVLGLSACILSSPYEVPTWMPQLLMNLSVHLNDPQPIEMTVKKTLSNFRRTHHDNWQEHKQQFTDDQLVILADLLVSPCYYA